MNGLGLWLWLGVRYSPLVRCIIKCNPTIPTEQRLVAPHQEGRYLVYIGRLHVHWSIGLTDKRARVMVRVRGSI